MRIYTKKGDDGTTGLLFGGRVWKDDPAPEAYGAVDEAVAALGVARAQASAALEERLLAVQRDLFVVAAELATAPASRHKLAPGESLVTDEMVARLEAWIDEMAEGVGLPAGFVVPGEDPLSAALDLARSVVRRAERRCVAYTRSIDVDGSLVVPYLNRLADLLYMLVRATEDRWQPSRSDEDGT